MSVELLAIISILPWAFYLIVTHPKKDFPRLILVVLVALGLGWASTELVLKLNSILWPTEVAETSKKAVKSLLSQTAFLAFVQAGMMEEACKSILILGFSLIAAFDRETSRFRPEAFLVGGFMALGFAGVENYQYIGRATDNERITTFISRTLMSSNAHLLINLCFSMFLIKSNGKPLGERVWYLTKAFFLAVSQHGLFDFFVFPSGRFGLWIAAALFVGIWVWIVKDRRMYIENNEPMDVELLGAEESYRSELPGTAR
ncbi:PrsW family glutamic-type intramembrane protease [Leptospira wolffii]|uniref:PrsW family glutamic-type intramembrane protease n=1 Tax=Leptospira wolffii TaxID=409998 RepID=A0ABV5BQY3_9LEPT